MAEWHELSEDEKKHANSIMSVINSLESTECTALNEIKHDTEAVKDWLKNHPKIRNTGIVFSSFTSLYIVKRIHMGR